MDAQGRTPGGDGTPDAFTSTLEIQSLVTLHASRGEIFGEYAGLDSSGSRMLHPIPRGECPNVGVSMFDFGKFAKRAWRASVPVWWEQLMLLLIALVGTWLAIHFGLFRPTDKHAAYEVTFLIAAFAIVLYMLVAIVRAINET